jgi:hypothetical protein
VPVFEVYVMGGGDGLRATSKGAFSRMGPFLRETVGPFYVFFRFMLFSRDNRAQHLVLDKPIGTHWHLHRPEATLLLPSLFWVVTTRPNPWAKGLQRPKKSEKSSLGHTQMKVDKERQWRRCGRKSFSCPPQSLARSRYSSQDQHPGPSTIHLLQNLSSCTS